MNKITEQNESRFFSVSMSFKNCDKLLKKVLVLVSSVSNVLPHSMSAISPTNLSLSRADETLVGILRNTKINTIVLVTKSSICVLQKCQTPFFNRYKEPKPRFVTKYFEIKQCLSCDAMMQYV